MPAFFVPFLGGFGIFYYIHYVKFTSVVENEVITNDSRRRGFSANQRIHYLNDVRSLIIWPVRFF